MSLFIILTCGSNWIYNTKRNVGLSENTINNVDYQKKRRCPRSKADVRDNRGNGSVWYEYCTCRVVNLHRRWEIYNTPYVVHKGQYCIVVRADNPITKCRFQLDAVLCVCRRINAPSPLGGYRANDRDCLVSEL